MPKKDYSGYWTGSLDGTNRGGIAFELEHVDDKITGIAKIREPSVGEYEYKVEGEVTENENLSARLKPIRTYGPVSLGVVQVVASIDSDGKLAGRWSSTIGTAGVVYATRFASDGLKVDLPKKNSVFIVHGHDEGAKHAVARFLEQIGIEPVILQEQINAGKTVIEKFEEFAARAGFAIVLITPDDHGYKVGHPEEVKHRPRQNVVLELGYFAAKLGRDKTIVLVKDELEMPSDILGLAYERLDDSNGWKMQLAKELRAAGFDVDLNKAI